MIWLTEEGDFEQALETGLLNFPNYMYLNVAEPYRSEIFGHFSLNHEG